MLVKLLTQAVKILPTSFAKMSTRATPALLQSLGSYSSCEIADAMIKLKHPHGGYIPDIDMYSPGRLKDDVKISGEAFCVQMVEGNNADAPKPSEHFVDAAEEGSVMVVACPPGLKNAVWGGLMTARAQYRGVKGVVIDGRCRDLVEHREAGFPVFARSHSILGQSPFTRPSTLQQPITIWPTSTVTSSTPEDFPPVTINPHDFVLADVDGVVVVPVGEMDRVLELCEKGRAVDARCLVDLKEGKGVKETFAKHRGK